MNFKQWFENESSEYDPPDEGVMNRLRNTPIRYDILPHLRGVYYRFRMPMGSTQHFLIKSGGKIGLNAPAGSLNARCKELENDKVKLYRLMQYLKYNNNIEMRKQLLAYKETQT